MSPKTFVFLFLIVFLTLTPITAEEESLNINIEFPSFYEVNIPDLRAKLIGASGLAYRGYVTVESPNKEIDLTNRSLEIRFYYSEVQKIANFDEATYKGAKPTYPIFWYDNYTYDKNPSGTYIKSFEFNDSFALSEQVGAKIRKGGNETSPLFWIGFLETGSYIMEWTWMTEKGESIYRLQRIDIIDPSEYEALLKQAQLIEAEKQSAEASEKSAEASEETALATRRLALISAGLVVATLVTAFLIPFLGERRKRKSLIRSLYVEIGHNKSAARKMIKIRRNQGVHELTPLDTLSYQNIRMTGEVLNLPETVPRELDELYELVNAHNRQLPAVYELIPRERGFFERLEVVSEKAEHLETKLLKMHRFLKTR